MTVAAHDAAAQPLALLQARAAEGVELSVCGEEGTVGVLAAVVPEDVTPFARAWAGAAIRLRDDAVPRFVRCDLSRTDWTAVTFYGDGLPDGAHRRLDAPVFGWGRRWSQVAATPPVLYHDVRAFPPSETARRLETLAADEGWPAESRAFDRTITDLAATGWLQYVALGARGGPKLIVAVARAEPALAIVRQTSPDVADRFEAVRRRLHGTIGYIAAAFDGGIRWRLYLRPIMTGNVAALVECAR